VRALASSFKRDNRQGEVLERGLERRVVERPRISRSPTRKLVRINVEKELAIDGLREAMNKISTLRGLLPICASCKKIRDDKGYWNQIEVYISEHTEADFSHGICPDCAKDLYGEILDR